MGTNTDPGYIVNFETSYLPTASTSPQTGCEPLVWVPRHTSVTRTAPTLRSPLCPLAPWPWPCNIQMYQCNRLALLFLYSTPAPRKGARPQSSLSLCPTCFTKPSLWALHPLAVWWLWFSRTREYNKLCLPVNLLSPHLWLHVTDHHLKAQKV